MANKKVLITGGNTQIPIDKVRVISNVFKGKTAGYISDYFGTFNKVTLLGNPEMEPSNRNKGKINFIPYKTYDDLYSLMEKEVSTGDYDVIIHSAAVSDYYVHGVFSELMGPYLDPSKKVSSSHDRLYLELRPTRKIVDDIRSLWNFKGRLVKFKLQVGITDEELLAIATKSRTDSNADIMVANCLEWASKRAYVITQTSIKKIERDQLPGTLALMLGCFVDNFEQMI